MLTKMDKRDRAQLFRERLIAAMQHVNATQSGLARGAGVDRSTLSQILKDQGARLPNAQMVAECAAALGVSTDWLLGLSDRPEKAEALVATAVSMTEAPRTMIDDQIFAWHQEAAGYKIRHIPAALPDMLKTPEMLEWEYMPSVGKTIEQAIGASTDRLTWMRASQSDYEIALPMSELETFARAEGYYEGVTRNIRIAQLRRIRDIHAQLYPSLRLHIFHHRHHFSAPVTVFGPLLAAIYIGRNYLVFRDKERVAAITQHFDALVRHSIVPPHQIGALVDDLIKAIH